MKGRASRQRDVVLETVRATMEHPTADRVYRQARALLPRISLGTVYRNLKRLSREGLIREVVTADNIVRYDGNIGPHYHIRCLDCGRVSDLPVSVDTHLEEEASRATSYQVLGHTVEVQGLCPLCRQEKGSTNNNSYNTAKEAQEA